MPTVQILRAIITRLHDEGVPEDVPIEIYTETENDQPFPNGALAQVIVTWERGQFTFDVMPTDIGR